MKRVLATLLALIMALSLAACGGSDEKAAEENTEATEAEAAQAFSGKKLMVFSGASLVDPVQKIADTFKEETGCEVQLVFATTGQLISQIQTEEEGDILIAGAQDELKNMKEDEITASIELVKHIPVVAVQKGNPNKVENVKDLGKDGLKILLTDPETTPIGKIAVKAIEDAGIKDDIDIVANTTTAPMAITALAEQEADGAIVWKENAATNENVEILDIPEMEKYIKVIPAASLKYSTNEEARTAFVKYLNSDAAMEIWKSFGYEPVK